MTTPTYASPEEVAGKLRDKYVRTKAEIIGVKRIETEWLSAGEVDDLFSDIATQRREDLEGHIADIEERMKALAHCNTLEEAVRYIPVLSRTSGMALSVLNDYRIHLTTLLAQDKK